MSEPYYLPWIRLYTDLINNPKVQRLPGELFKFWINLLCVAGRQSVKALPGVDDLSFALRLPPDTVSGHLSALVQARLLIRQGSSYFPHDWDDWQYKSDSSRQRMRRHRDGKRDGAVTVQSRADTDTEQNRTEEEKSAAASPPPGDKSPPAKPPNPEPKGYVLDELYARFRSEYRDWTEHYIEEDFSNGAWHEWRHLDGEQRMNAVTGVERDRQSTDPAFAPSPKIYLKERRWKRPPRPAAKPVQKVQSLAQKLLGDEYVT